MLYCNQCGASVREGARFCTSCGAPISPSETQVPPQEPAYSQPSYPQEPTYHQQSYQSDGYQSEPQQRQMVYRRPEPRYQGQAPLYGSITIGGIFSRAMGILSTKPLTLWGLSLMYCLLIGLAVPIGVIPVISFAITFALNVGISAIFLYGIRGKEVNSDLLFVGFKNFFRSAGGIAWMMLWQLIWFLVPIVGLVLMIIKSYSYRFVPYILADDSEITATAALRRSMELTNGLKLKMFLKDILLFFGYIVVVGVLIFLARIPFIGRVFLAVLVIFSLVFGAFFPLFYGLVEAAFYDESTRK